MHKQPLSVLVLLKGMAIGVANIIPGVSGGTIAVITGLYDELMEAFGAFFSSEGGWRRNLLFLLPVILGVVIGSVAFARVIGGLLAAVPVQTNLFFIGLIVGSMPYLAGKARSEAFSPWCIAAFAVGIGLVLWMGLAERPTASPPITELSLLAFGAMFAASIVASFALVVPGISGSFVLLLLGMYTTMQTAFGTMNWPLVAVFVFGHIFGIVLVARFITYLLQRFHSPTYFAIIGLVLGSIVSLWEPIPLDMTGLTGAVAALLGAVLSAVLGTGTKERLVARLGKGRRRER
ncbi:DUF368 domain-containing protein [Spirochaeta africana]|uniref:Putative membrane protein n=1 Tax=Spirochaeta africana (strain ATCC 700263 / DSM 8902 / Z-7692) TaxID=889378 RepID=H9UKL8_SPIAZ|nr:DUF368 domain-containing protein [Spirochaeta africana]AFG38061.1 putative membrane protein [Spirochaeta africana DSM 8902]